MINCTVFSYRECSRSECMGELNYKTIGNNLNFKIKYLQRNIFHKPNLPCHWS